MPARRFVVTPEEHGERLERVLARRFVGSTRRQLRELIRVGQVRVEGRRAAKGRRLAAGETVELAALPAATSPPEPEPALPLVVVHEDPHLVIVDKPAGMPVQPLRPGERGTLAGAVLARYPETRGLGRDPREPGLVHRLDVGTSGLVMVARDQPTLAALSAALGQGEIDKRYLALVAGELEGERLVDAPVGHHPRDRRRMVVGAGGRSPRPARTWIAALASRGGLTLLEVRTLTGRMHQVRVHLASLGHPLAGYSLYGGPELPGLERPFLHASVLGFRHPATGEPLRVEAPLPLELVALLEALGFSAPA